MVDGVINTVTGGRTVAAGRLPDPPRRDRAPHPLLHQPRHAARDRRVARGRPDELEHPAAARVPDLARPALRRVLAEVAELRPAGQATAVRVVAPAIAAAARPGQFVQRARGPGRALGPAPAPAALGRAGRGRRPLALGRGRRRPGSASRSTCSARSAAASSSRRAAAACCWSARATGSRPLLALADQAAGRELSVTLLAGFASAERALPAAWIAPQVEYLVATDDGSAGHRGAAVDLVGAVPRLGGRGLRQRRRRPAGRAGARGRRARARRSRSRSAAGAAAGPACAAAAPSGPAAGRGGSAATGRSSAWPTCGERARGRPAARPAAGQPGHRGGRHGRRRGRLRAAGRRRPARRGRRRPDQPAAAPAGPARRLVESAGRAGLERRRARGRARGDAAGRPAALAALARRRRSRPWPASDLAELLEVAEALADAGGLAALELDTGCADEDGRALRRVAGPGRRADRRGARGGRPAADRQALAGAGRPAADGRGGPRGRRRRCSRSLTRPLLS